MVEFIRGIDGFPLEIRILAANLDSLNLDDYETRSDRTRAITQVVFDWAEDCNWSPELEFRIDGVYREQTNAKRKIKKLIPKRRGLDNQTRRGDAIADVYIDRDSLEPGMRLPPLVIEIDSANKKWSLTKLEKCSEKGWDCLWVRWGPNEPIPTPEDIMCIYIPFKGKRVRKGSN